MAWYGMVWKWYGRHGMEWRSMVGYSRVWHGIVWYENSMVWYSAAGHQTNQGVMA